MNPFNSSDIIKLSELDLNSDKRPAILCTKREDVLKTKGYQIWEETDSYILYWFPVPIINGCLFNIIYQFWTGDNDLSANRLNSLDQFRNISECRTVLITNSMLKRFVPDLHPAYYLLSLVHRSDYLRSYFMKHYGGGYSDIKKTTGSWKMSFDILNKNEDLYGIGYKEIGEGGVVNIYNDIPMTQILHANWEKLLGNGAYIFKNDTIFTNEWYNNTVKLLTNKTEELKAKPPQGPRDRHYGLRWSELLGDIFHPLCYKYHTKLSNQLPMCNLNNYE